MAEKLTTHNAQVTTATVEVKTLTVSGKRVTLSVFRQLRERRLVSPADGSLAGVPWGYVNYHPDKCDSDGEHLHVIWQIGDNLYRNRVDEPMWFEEVFYSEWAGDAIQGKYCSNGHQRPKWLDRVNIWDDDESGPRDASTFRINAVTCEAPAVYMYHHSIEECMSEIDSKKAWDCLKAEVAEEAARRKALKERWTELSALPQLFIAV
ncbi:hypothetical protein [Nonomuraea zeae]|uniref:Uncharacterized protein n=1 Tax=Nonomuraea zeae TaxID=1642303 RepID=A0A5S4H4C1_9ACTN|nr:hypothetical protein [Nonomuraea zeae]TMR39594.1 hypothetical protein ETD85_00855 [Nonomuraea zeae]